MNDTGGSNLDIARAILMNQLADLTPDEAVLRAIAPRLTEREREFIVQQYHKLRHKMVQQLFQSDSQRFDNTSAVLASRRILDEALGESA